jgi:hypothetical protein
MNPLKSSVLVFLVVMNTSVWAAENSGGAWTHPEVLKAALAIGMTDEQKPKFGNGITGFFNCRIEAFKRVMKGRDNVDIERKMKSKTNACLRKMDKEMHGFLTEAQLPKYEIYRDTLTSKLTGM